MKAAKQSVRHRARRKVVPVHEFAQDVENAIKTVEDKQRNCADAQAFLCNQISKKDDKIAEQMKSDSRMYPMVKALEDKFDDDAEIIIWK